MNHAHHLSSLLNSNLSTLNNNVGNIKKFASNSGVNDYVLFNRVPIAYRISALFIGNGNGLAYMRNCALFSNGTASDDSISSGEISAVDNGDGTANITISHVPPWGFYSLIIFY